LPDRAWIGQRSGVLFRKISVDPRTANVLQNSSRSSLSPSKPAIRPRDFLHPALRIDDWLGTRMGEG